MKQYLLSVHYVEGQEPPAPEVMQEMYQAVSVFNADLQASGAWVFAGGLHTPDVSTVVRPRGARILVPGGLSAEARSRLGGVWVVRSGVRTPPSELASRAAIPSQR